MRVKFHKSLLIIVALMIMSNHHESMAQEDTAAAASQKEHEAPVLDITNESAGYTGKISEHSVLVDLLPHLQIKNIEAINGICSFHVFKPNNEEFPFTIEIKDKSTGEAMIEVVRKDVSKTQELLKSTAKRTAHSILLDCNKRKEYDFLIQAHDCSMPSLYSNKVPVRIEVFDNDDYLLQFTESEYHATLVESDKLHENFMTVKAKDFDCTNNGFACAYSLDSHEADELPFKIDTDGQISTVSPLTGAHTYEFTVRAYDCVSTESYIETKVIVSVVEKCRPQWIDFPKEILSTGKSANLLEEINPVICDNLKAVQDDSSCHIDSASSKLELSLSSSIENICESKNCDNTHPQEESSKLIIFSGESNLNKDDDSIEDDYYDQNKIKQEPIGINLQSPLNYRSFSKQIENAQKIHFDGKFGNRFSLNTWLRRPANADKTIKEQVLCGSDSHAMNRHHFGLYFYRSSIKFLMRKENSEENKDDQFYPSLWEWSLPENVLKDDQWHFYEIKLNYPTALLYIDGIHFVENKTNSDIIDAYELAESDNSGDIATYIGACYHARTNSLVDHFEGDIGSVVMIKNHVDNHEKKACKAHCSESIEMNMVGNENFINSIKQESPTEISINTSNLNEMSQILRKISYINTDLYAKEGSRTIRLSTTVHCANSGKQVSLRELAVDLKVRQQKHEYNVQLEGDKTQLVYKSDLENGIEPFRDISIFAYEINKIDDSSIESGEAKSTESNDVLLSQCSIRILPKRNLMAVNDNFEKVMFLQNLLDEYKFDFKETEDTVMISGVQTVKNYETFIRRLTYVITNANEIKEENFLKEKSFIVSCLRDEPKIETNEIIIQLNIIGKKLDKAPAHHFMALKQTNKLVVAENDNDIVMDSLRAPHTFNLKGTKTSPLMMVLIAMCICGMGFFLIFGAIRMNSVFMGRKRKLLPNEENPNMDGMEWDDSGLNITENPLDKLEGKADGSVNINENLQLEYEDEEEYTSNEEDEEEYDQYEDQYSSEEDCVPSVEKGGLEWDDTSIGIKMAKNKKLEMQNSQSSINMDGNKFV